MKKKCIEFLLVEKPDGSAVLVIAEPFTAEVGNLVAFDGGKTGKVAMKEWVGERDCGIQKLISSLIPTYEAEAVYRVLWEKEADSDDTVPGDS